MKLLALAPAGAAAALAVSLLAPPISLAFSIAGPPLGVDQREFGILLYGTNGRSNLAFHNGRLCVKAPLTRLLPPKSSGSTGLPPCTGVLRVNFNARIQSGSDPSLVVGQRVNAQWIYRDPGVDAFGDGLTEAAEFFVNP